MLEREQLLSKLGIVQPALAENDLVPAYTHYLFHKNKLIAYNDRIGISTPLKCEFAGAVAGKTLSMAVGVVQSSNIKLTTTNNAHVVLTAGRAKASIPMLPPEDYTHFFKMPNKPEGGMKVDDDFLLALDDCLQSVDSNAPVPDKLGITVIPSKDELHLYSSDGITLTRAILKTPSDNAFKQRCILSSEFAKEVLKMGRKEGVENKRLTVAENHAIFVADDVVLFGRLLTGGGANFAKVVEDHLPKNFAKFPSLEPRTRVRLKQALDLAHGFSGVEGNEPHTEIEVVDGKVRFHARSQRGEANDSVDFPKHPNTKCKVLISRIAKAYDRYSDIMFDTKTVFLRRDKTLFLVATVASGA